VSPIYITEDKANRLLPLFDALIKNKQRSIENETLFSVAYPKEIFDEKAFSYLKSDLTDLLEEYLIFKEFRQDGLQKNLYLLKALRKNKVEVNFESYYKNVLKKNEKQALRNEDYHFFLAKLNHEFYRNHVLTERTIPDEAKKATDQFNHYSLAQSLRTLCIEAANAQALNVAENQLYEKRKGYILKSAQTLEDNENAPIVIRLYLTCYKMVETQSIEAYQAFETVLKANLATLSSVELCDLLILMTSFCSKKINTGDRSFLQKSLDWYELGLEKKVFIEEGTFSIFFFKNIVTAAVGLKKYNWAIQFIETYHLQLYSTQQENLKNYTLAIVYFNQGQNDKVYYEKAMVLLSSVELDDVFHLLDIRRMLVRCYYELQEWNALESLIKSFRKYLNRHKNDLNYQYQNYSNFITFVERLQVIRESDKPKRFALRTQLDESPQVAERAWLESKMV
jgi:hypothetical protein